MKLPIAASILFIGRAGFGVTGQAHSGPLTGTLERLWEDDFSINIREVMPTKELGIPLSKRANL
jgi:hypothetical protein